MKQFLKTKGVIIGAVAFVFVLIGFLSAFLTAGQTSFIQNGINAAVRPVETGIRTLVATLERMYDHMHNYDQLESEHQALLDRVARYEALAREAADVKEENERLRDLLELTQGIHNERYIDAHVQSWDSSNWTSAFTIDVGEEAGVRVGDPVMTERREFVGVVRQVGTGWATVRTILDPAVRVGGQLGTGVAAVAEGNFALMQDWALRLSYVPSSEIPLLNDTITTSGLGGVIPQGLVIGQIRRVGMEDTGVAHYAVIEPSVDLGRLVQVFVVQRTDAADNLDTETEDTEE